MRDKTIRIGTSFLCVFALISLMYVSVDAAKEGFSGKWKGEIGSAAPARGGAQGVPALPATQFAQRGGGGRGAAGGGPGGFGGAAARVQKVTLNLKTKDNETKASGNITIGETTDDVKEGKIEGERVTFRAGTSPAPIYEYTGQLKGDEIIMTRTAPASGRGAQSVQFTLKRD